MKIGMIVLASIFLNGIFYSVFAMPHKTDLEMQGLSGPVQTVVEVVEGRFIWTSRYDQQGNLAEFLADSVDRKESSEGGEKHAYEYDVEGKRIKATGYAEDGKVFEREAYSYDTQGNRAAEIVTFPNGTLKAASFYAYDGKGNRSSWIKYVGHKLLHTTSFTYDEQGKVVREVHYDNGLLNLDCKQTHALDRKGKESLCYKVNGDLYSKGVERYDDKGNIIERASYDSDGMPVSKTTYTYQHDVIGNWISRVSQEWHTYDGKFVLKETRTQERKISYYKRSNPESGVNMQ